MGYSSKLFFIRKHRQCSCWTGFSYDNRCFFKTFLDAFIEWNAYFYIESTPDEGKPKFLLMLTSQANANAAFDTFGWLVNNAFTVNELHNVLTFIALEAFLNGMLAIRQFAQDTGLRITAITMHTAFGFTDSSFTGESFLAALLPG